MKAFLIPLDRINDLQCKSIERLVDRARGAHYTDVNMRIDGHDEHFEADWIKHIQVVPEVDDLTKAKIQIANLLERMRNMADTITYYQQFAPRDQASPESGRNPSP